ncbi:MAG: DUF971 domain-containing protein [Dehalococcoidia bacterium]|nr:DUF971 domain-containing protein [Dehalococcoidia bacterium]
MPAPKQVVLSPESIRITWDDGHQSTYANRYLRGQCRCAGCVDEMSGRRRVSEKNVPEDVQAVDWIQVGYYGLQFLWTDLHAAGIYTHEMLRSLCPCPQCQPVKPAAQ